jgi:MYXO-CTERM domain-containing protein
VAAIRTSPSPSVRARVCLGAETPPVKLFARPKRSRHERPQPIDGFKPTGCQGLRARGRGRRSILCAAPSRSPHQALEPVYEWLDTWTAVPGYPLHVFDVYDSADLAANRDYYQYTTTFDGSSGVGSGTLAMRPASCMPLVAYWATDTNTLYQCTSANTWTTYYSPYVYPHPLDTSDDAGVAGGADGGVLEGGSVDDASVPNDATTATDAGQHASSSSGGCGCRFAGAPPSKGVLATLGLGVLLTVARRRRRGG